MNAHTPNQTDNGRKPGAIATDADEPELGSEESVPSDGKDEKGEQMMEELGRERRGER